MIRAAIFFQAFFLCSMMTFVVFTSASEKITVVPAISGNPILSNSKIIGGIVSNNIKVSLVAGEYEPVSFVIESDQDLSQLMLVAHPIKGHESIIDQRHIDIKLVKEWYQADQAWIGRWDN